MPKSINITQEDIDRLQELLEEIKERAMEFERIVQGAGSETRHVQARMKAYPMPHLRMALDDDHDYHGSCDPTLTDIISELEECVEELFDGDEKEGA